ncbi:hypothetical protein [Syntrophomonas erecta]
MEEERYILGIPSTVFTSEEWKALEKREYAIGPEKLMDEIIDQRLWSNAEIAWVLKRMIYYYGKKDAYLKKVPVDRLFMNLVDILRAFYLIIDNLDPDLDDNLRLYISAKLTDSTWGINTRTREYLYKI